MGLARDSLKVRVLRAIEELLKERPADQRHVDTDMVLQRIRLEGSKDDVALCMSELWENGYVRGKALRGANKVMDVTVTAITEKGSQLLWE